VTGPAFLGVDVGTQSVRAAIYRPDGTCLASGEVPLALHRRGEEVSQDPREFCAATTAAIAACTAAASAAGSGRGADIAAIGIAGQMAGILGIGPGGEPVTPYDSWLDSRCRAQVAELAARLGDRGTELTGCPPMVAHAPKILWWQRTQPAAYAAVAAFVVPSAFVAGWLCGLPADRAFIDWTHLHFAGLADAAAGTWSAELAGAAGIDLARLPRIAAPADQVGTLAPAAAAACGLRAGIPVAAGLGDTAAGALGAGVVRPGQLLDTAGTASVLGVSAARFRADPSRTLVQMRGAVGGQWIALAYLAGGDLLGWLPRVLGAPLPDLLAEAAAAAPGRLLFVPHLGGRILPAAPRARGGWLGLELSQGRGDLVRAVLESVAFEYAGFLARARALLPDLEPREVRVIGGGSENRLWNQVKAAALGIPYLRPRRDSFSCWGAALVAAAAVGAVDDLAGAALAATAGGERIEPDPALAAAYASRLGDYQEAVGLLAPPDHDEDQEVTQ
jgi:xylulokinase